MQGAPDTPANVPVARGCSNEAVDSEGGDCGVRVLICISDVCTSAATVARFGRGPGSFAAAEAELDYSGVPYIALNCTVSPYSRISQVRLFLKVR